MHLSWHGQYTIKIETANRVLVIDPYAPEVGLSPFRAKADIVALSNPSDPSMSNFSGILGGPIVVDTPGEYVLEDIGMHGLGWRGEDGSERTIMLWRLEEVVLLHVGALNRALTDAELSAIETTDIDVLLVPVGGGASLTTAQALQLVTTIEPRMIIPIHFALAGLKEKLTDVTAFVKEMGADPKHREKKIIIKKNKLPQQDVATVLLDA